MPSPVKLSALDHLVLTVRDIEATVRFYESVLGMRRETFGDGRIALKFGEQKINLHVFGSEFRPKAALPTPGSADLCFISETAIDDLLQHLQSVGVDIIEGPLQRTGAMGPVTSIYVRDPDGNLVELANYPVP